MQSKFTSYNEIGYHYDLYGNENAPETVLMLHGFTGGAATWQDAAPHWVSPTRSVVAFDLIGHGQSNSPAQIMPYQVLRQMAVLFYLFKKPLHLIGYSMGGRLALHLVQNFPHRVKSLVLESTTAGIKAEAERAARRAADETLANRIEHDGIAAFVDHWENLPLFATQKQLPDAVRARLQESRLRNNAVGLAYSLRGFSAGRDYPKWEVLHKYTQPTLLIAGELDEKYAQIATEMHALMPNSQLRIVPDAGHAVHLEQPELFRQAVVDFLDSIP